MLMRKNVNNDVSKDSPKGRSLQHSGKHVATFPVKDLDELVKKLVDKGVFQYHFFQF